MSMKFLVLGGGILGFGGGGGSADFIVMGARFFLIDTTDPCRPSRPSSDTFHIARYL